MASAASATVACIATAAILFAQPASSAWSQGDVGVANNGHNMTSFSMKTNTTVECYNACIANAACKAWQMTVSSTACTAGGPAVCTLKSSYGGDWVTMEGPLNPCSLNPCAISGPVARDGTPLLQPVAFQTAPLAAVTPSGWLANQLAVQARGLSGFLYDFWPDVRNSSWVGGTADGYLHERGPYWLNGIVPLGVLTGGDKGIGANVTAQARGYLAYIAAHQAESGWLGPDDTASGDQFWARFNVISSMLAWVEGHPEDAAVYIPVALKYVPQATYRTLGGGPMNYTLNDWSAARVQDYLLSLYTLIDAFPSLEAAGLVPPGVSEATLYDAAAVAHGDAIEYGAQWETYFALPPGNCKYPGPGTCFPNDTVTGGFGMLTHGVNVAQAIKSAGVWWRQANNASLIASTYSRYEVLDKYHGSPAGVVQADEHLAGFEPQHGTELCGVVEAAFSAEVLGDILGDPVFYDRTESIIFNALPASMTKDTWAHNYLSQANEAQAIISDPHVWVTDGPAGNIYGLQPNYGCCTANMHQGWPRFAARLAKINIATGGVAVTLWAPGTTTLNLPSGGTATVAVDTDYPFGDTATITVTAAQGTPVSLRVPGWATAATLSVNGAAPQPIGAKNGTFVTIPTSTQPSCTFTVDFAPSIRVDTRWWGGSAAVYRGALLYALRVGEDFATLANNPYESKDYAVTPTTPWAYALVVDPANPDASLSFTRVGPPPALPFNATAPPVMITGTGRPLPNWGLFNNSADTPPGPSPLDCSSAQCGAGTPITLVPYGSTHLRMAVLPWTRA